MKEAWFNYRYYPFLYRLGIPGFQPEDRCFVTFPPDPATLPNTTLPPNSTDTVIMTDIVYYAPNNTNSSRYCAVCTYTCTVVYMYMYMYYSVHCTCTCTVVYMYFYYITVATL